MKLRLVEHYTSIEGEGPRTGVPTQFVRFAGCNLRCPGWPCDTQYAIQPSIWMSESYTRDSHELVDDIYKETDTHGALNVALTGGEPFIQPANLLAMLAADIHDAGYTIEVFTNGTQPLPPWALRHAQINMDWKLQGSGEAGKHGSIVKENASKLKQTDMIKFVCVDKGDFREALQVINQWPSDAQYWFGVAWNVNYTVAQLVEDLQAHPEVQARVNVQVHKYIWRDTERGV